MDKLKQVSEMPTTGQFVAVWVYHGGACSHTLLWNDGELMVVGSGKAPWRTSSTYPGATFFVADSQ